MRHARGEALDRIEPLLARLRGLEGLVEKARGVFYHRSRAFLHFHEDPSGLFADVRLQGSKFERLPIDSVAQQDALVREILKARTE